MNKTSERDTCLRMLAKYAQEDTFLYTRYYQERAFHDGRFSYVRTGQFIYQDKKSAVIIYTPTDSTVAVELYSCGQNSWVLLDKKTDLPQNGMNFYTDYSDYNFDGINDIYINVIVSNGLGLSTGHLLTVTEKGTFVSHPETLEISDMSPDSITRTVNAHEAMYCKDDRYICNRKYKWENDKLVVASQPCACAN